MTRTLLALLAAGGLAAVAFAQTTARQPASLRAAQAEAARQAKPRPAVTDQSMLLELVPAGDDGKAVRVQAARQIAGPAPKVFARSGGDWEVRLIGPRPVSYRIVNPLLDVEVENGPGAPSPFSQVRGDPTPVRIVVPLSRSGRLLDVQRIEVVDLASNRTVLSVPVGPGR